MKILMLGWELPPHNSGGLGVACYQLCKNLAESGADIDFVLPYDADHQISFMNITAAHPQGIAAILKSGIAYDSYKYIYEDGHEETLSVYDQQSLYEMSVARLAEQKEFDIIHAHDWLTFRAGIRVKQQSGKPLIAHVHSIESDRAGGAKGNPIVRDIEYNAFLVADKIIAVSDFTRQSIVREYGIPVEKIEVVHNSIDPQLFEELEGENTYRYLQTMKQQGYRVVVNVGRLTIQKGLTGFLKAAKLVVDHRPKTIFLIVGNGDQYEELVTLAADLGIGRNVLFVGFQRGSRWRDAFAVADLFVMPSVSEPFGIVALEAVGYGTPVLMSRQSGVSEVLQNALKVDFWDEKEMANQMVGALSSQPLLDEMLAGSTREYNQMSWVGSANKIMGLYAEHQGAAA
ncbi:MAG: glycosyltransferase family 4 protein [Candidatus Saccharibacteria bacterium]|nr:glycosyltransferase family 4 protein [Candidatus Saccharibacteria bacterium]